MPKKSPSSSKKKMSQSDSSMWSCINQVTSFSRVMAAVFFIILPFIGFFIGMAYQAKLMSYYLP